ncbi:MAG TPA: gamma carbonic anhydrase family protein, partial [Pyrinomonadaceae bacterium]|nr:gamma carbonic anhydrase family protein [Pyrinomonadaceae bacterium]
TIGHNATIHGCHIESGSLIGIGAIVLDGARIGRNSLVAAGSLSLRTRSFPSARSSSAAPRK